MAKLGLGKPRSIHEALLGPDVLNLFNEPRGGATSSAVAAPAVEPMPPIPEPEGPEAEAERRRSIARQKARRGRASTIFTQPEGQGLGG